MTDTLVSQLVELPQKLLHVQCIKKVKKLVHAGIGIPLQLYNRTRNSVVFVLIFLGWNVKKWGQCMVYVIIRTEITQC